MTKIPPLTPFLQHDQANRTDVYPQVDGGPTMIEARSRMRKTTLAVMLLALAVNGVNAAPAQIVYLE